MPNTNPMSPDVHFLVQRRITSLCDQHASELHAVSNALLGEINVARNVTVADGLEALPSRMGEALTEHLRRMSTEVISIVQQTETSFGPNDKAAVLAMATKSLPDSIHVDRLRLFLEAVGRQFSRAGMALDLPAFRPDLIEARLHAGTSHVIRAFARSFADELEVIVQQQLSRAARSVSAPEGKLTS